ncbi:hypothetical protein SLEP1_g34089 [Rubroshorea leprosula]|uniref:NB-ARC domain-containing protein n=1 Tax=Rubroshorea leprosula TaxID=152421 RepID=A0AAV5KIZ5_9ROSI|nr:hypothetical protein SLEP1_g34089 [Rubroshorea leprosula]
MAMDPFLANELANATGNLLSDCVEGVANYVGEHNGLLNRLEPEDNFESILKEEAERLRALRDDNEQEIRQNKTKTTSSCYNQWLGSVTKILPELETIQAEYEQQRNVLIECAIGSKFWEKVTNILQRVQKLMEEGKFQGFLIDKPPEPVIKLGSVPDIKATATLQGHLEEILLLLSCEEVKTIVIWGPLGVGKTTIMQNLNNHEEVEKMFQMVIWITVSEERTIEKLQMEIASRLKLNLQGTETAHEVARSISEELKDRKYLLLLDDVKGVIDHDQLSNIGVPDNKNGSKVVLTTEDLRVCSKMKLVRNIEVEKLTQREAWEMFKQIVTDQKIKIPGIKPVAQRVAKECGGLPLVISSVASYFKLKNSATEWRNGLEELRNGTEVGIPHLTQIQAFWKFCYDDLKDENKKGCFLYGALHPADTKICKPVLSESPNCPSMEGSFKHKKEKIVAKDESDQEPEDKLPFSVERDTNASSKQRVVVKEEMPGGEEWHANAIFLTDCKPVLSESPNCPSMERSFKHKKEKIVAKDESDQEPEDKLPFSVERDTNASSKQRAAVKEEMPEGEEWHANAIFLTDCKPVLPESPNCPFMGLLSFEGCKALRTIPSSFFNRMPVLKSLNLSHTSVRSLPVSLFKLDSLENLILRCCKLFVELSPQIGQLHNLLKLDLDDTQIVGLPKEIGMLSNLEILKFSLDECMNCGKQLRQNVLIQPGTIKSLFKLTELKIDVNPDSEGWNAVEEVVVEEACSLKRLKSLTLYLPHVQILGKRRAGSTSLNFYPLSSFRFTIGQHRQRIFSRVPEKVEAHFEKWDKCLKFVRGSDISSEMKRVVGYTKAFYLERHTSARSLCDFGIENMENLEFCLLAECNKIQTIIDGGKPHEEEQTDMVEGEATNCESYSAQEPALLNLQFLHIYYLEHLESIWSNPTYDKPCLSALKFLELHTCPKLEVILSPTLLTNLGKLEVLIVKDCPELISIVSRESNASFKFASDCFLPRLKMMLLLFLPKLESISREFHIAPKLKMIGFYDCSELRDLCKRELSSENLEVIKGERKWWKALKWEESEWGNHLDYLHTIFSPIDEDDHVMTQMEETYKSIEGIAYLGNFLFNSRHFLFSVCLYQYIYI